MNTLLRGNSLSLIGASNSTWLHTVGLASERRLEVWCREEDSLTQSIATLTAWGSTRDLLTESNTFILSPTSTHPNYMFFLPHLWAQHIFLSWETFEVSDVCVSLWRKAVIEHQSRSVHNCQQIYFIHSFCWWYDYTTRPHQSSPYVLDKHIYISQM